MPYFDLHFLRDVDQNKAQNHQERAEPGEPRGQRAVNQQVRDHGQGDRDGHADGGDGGGGEHHGAGPEVVRQHAVGQAVEDDEPHHDARQMREVVQPEDIL